ncbi:hypothetical protein [Rubrolithibacter danxiaensis]|uniref:hypothetical protein n=1 Tax=Rubrolithibacter danxiaensis TaxID=3390805 RepID=UPI003BF89FC6
MSEFNKQEKSHWTKAKPEKIPSPTYWPFFLAMGFAFLLWGIVAGWMISVAGLLILIISLTGWITILRDENNGNRTK